MNRSQRITLWLNGAMLALAAVPFGFLALLKGCEQSLVTGVIFGTMIFTISAGGAAICFWGATTK